MNPFYHEFSVGFNFWMVYAPVVVILMAILGWRVYRREGLSLVKTTDEKKYFYLCLALTAVFAVMLAVESSAGIVQHLDNGLTQYESGALSLIGAPLAIILAAACFYLLLFVCFYVAELVKIGWLYLQVERIQSEQVRNERLRRARVRRAREEQEHLYAREGKMSAEKRRRRYDGGHMLQVTDLCYPVEDAKKCRVRRGDDHMVKLK